MFAPACLCANAAHGILIRKSADVNWEKRRLWSLSALGGESLLCLGDKLSGTSAEKKRCSELKKLASALSLLMKTNTHDQSVSVSRRWLAEGKTNTNSQPENVFWHWTVCCAVWVRTKRFLCPPSQHLFACAQLQIERGTKKAREWCLQTLCWEMTCEKLMRPCHDFSIIYPTCVLELYKPYRMPHIWKI